MRCAVSSLLLGMVAALAVSLPAPPAAAQTADPDPWWGRDKALHFGASAVISSGGYGVGTLLFERSRLEPALFGGGVALAVGAAKEGADALGLGDPSWKDFTWDVIGTVVGLAIALGIDLALRPHLPANPSAEPLPR